MCGETAKNLWMVVSFFWVVLVYFQEELSSGDHLSFDDDALDYAQSSS